MKNIEKILINKSASIREVLALIDANAMQIALVVDEGKKLIGTITDGDVRRGLLKGVSLTDSIESIIFYNPITAKLSDSKEEIVKKSLAKELHQIPILDEQSCVVGLVEIEELIRPIVKKNKVVLMVGGLGTRLYPLTHDIPKSLLKVGDKPILQNIVERFADYGFLDIIMCVNHKADMIQDYFGDGKKFGVSIEYILETERMGTAGALSLLTDKPDEAFFVMNGDLLTNVNFEHLLDYHKIQNSMATMCVREYDFQIPYGVVDIEESHILSINEKPTHKFFVSAGIYMLSPSALDLIPSNQFYDMPSLFEKIITLDKNAISFPIHEYWLDIGRINEYEQANREYHEVFGV
jgi:dTDP-glucose pyrophosphorylase/predicted transcriptional regulator